MNTFGLDENGIIITEVSVDKITPQYKIIVTEVLNTIVQKFESELDGVYLYGSVATGKAIEGKSDLDMILIFKEKATEELSKEISSLEEKLTREYQLIVRDVGLATTYVDDALSERERLGGLCFLKHLCVCIYGNDLTKDISGFKPSKEVAKGFNEDIAKVLQSNKVKIENAILETEIKNLSQSIAKKIIRTGFSLVMPRANSWTIDLQISIDIFIRYYPEKMAEMNTALAWAKDGTLDKQAVILFINTFGLWLVNEFENQILTN